MRLLVARIVTVHCTITSSSQVEIVKVVMPREPSLGMQLEEVARGGDGRGLVLVAGTVPGGNAEATGKVWYTPLTVLSLLSHFLVMRVHCMYISKADSNAENSRKVGCDAGLDLILCTSLLLLSDKRGVWLYSLLRQSS